VPWLTPDTLGEGTDLCRSLLIPNDLRIIAAVTGALYDLTLPENWELFGTITPAEIASRMGQLLDEYLLSECQAGSAMPIGVVFPYLTAEPPAGSVPMDGTEYADTDYPAFWDVVDPAWKTDSTHWAAPDLGGRFPLAADGGDYQTGDTGGEATHTLTENEMPAHSGHHGASNVNIGAQSRYTSDTPAGITKGGGAAHNNMPPYLTLPYAVQVE
jgi:microcystin-dependent protein